MRLVVCYLFVFFFFKQKTAYEMRISDWSSDVCSSDLERSRCGAAPPSRGPTSSPTRGAGRWWRARGEPRFPAWSRSSRQPTAGHRATCRGSGGASHHWVLAIASLAGHPLAVRLRLFLIMSSILALVVVVKIGRAHV